MFGLLNINKPSDITSRRVVDRVQRLVRPHKVGHAGTLDPLATGVLVLCIGSATRLIEYVQRMQKRYRASYVLGCHSPTEDTEGEITELENPPIPTLAEVQAAAMDWTGTIQQRPPAYSALKVNGRRAYDLARQGQQPVLALREITIHQLDVVEYAYPHLELLVACSSGTYIRSLGRDLAVSVGTAAVMTALTRTAIGRFDLPAACELDALDENNLREHLLPAARAVEELPNLALTEQEAIEIRHGRRIDRDDLSLASEYSVTHDGRFIAILSKHGGTELQPSKVFLPA